MRLSLLLPVLCVACVAQPAADLSWGFEARAVPGEIRVMPVIGPADLPEVDLESWVGAGLTPDRMRLREARTESLRALPDAVRLALPGQVHAALQGSWSGEFSVGRYPIGSRERVRSALRTGQPLDEALGSVARAARSAVLITWVERVEGIPLTVHAPPGEVVTTAVGPVLVDLFDEPYQVDVRLGCALVAADGEVVVRYSDSFETVVSSTRDADLAGRSLAEALALEVAKVWPADPRLELAMNDAPW